MWYKIPVDSKQLSYLVHIYDFFQDNFYQNILQVHYENLNEFIILHLENSWLVFLDKFILEKIFSTKFLLCQKVWKK